MKGKATDEKKKCETHKNGGGFDLFSVQFVEGVREIERVGIETQMRTGWLEQCEIGCFGKIQIYAVSLESKDSTQTSAALALTTHSNSTPKQKKKIFEILCDERSL